MVAEACQDSPTIYTGSIYYGYGDIAHTNISGSPKVSLCDITPPWTGTPIVDELLTEDIPETYSSGTERYVVTMFDGFIGEETKSAKFRECWYTEDGNRYVKTGGSDSGIGNNWANAWLTMGYGFQNIPSGKDLYVEEGLYGGETLSNLNPPQTMEMYIQPDTHDENPCRVFVSDGSIVNVGTCVVGSSQGRYSDLYTAINRTAITSDCTLATFCMHANDAGGANADIKLKVFRSDGTNYNVVHTSDEWINISGSHEFEVIFPVLSGDYIGFSLRYVLYSSIKLETTGGSYHHVAGDINTSVPISSCVASSWLYTFGATGLS